MDCKSISLSYILVIFLSLAWCRTGVAQVDYKQALKNSLLFYEAQRSGKLPPTQRVEWRGDSALTDGSDANIDLSGGYYDAGDNVKFGFPMAFTITILSWSVLEYSQQLLAAGELINALEAVRWGADYLLKAHAQDDVLYGEVGEGNSDHECWQRPEDMTTPRTTFKIDAEHPGADLAAETAAALAAATMAFDKASSILNTTLERGDFAAHAAQLFSFAQNHPGKYSDSITVAGQFYSSSGYADEILWAAAWLYRLTKNAMYEQVLINAADKGGDRTMFSWDDKFVGAQVLAANYILYGHREDSGAWGEYKSHAERFICNCIQKGNNNVKKSPGGMLWFAEWSNLQYTTSATFIVTVYSDYLAANGKSIECPGGLFKPADLISFAKSQADYILGANPSKMSYMVGYGASYPGKVHHRGASIVSIKKDPTPVTCKGGFDTWFNSNEVNPNTLVGAVVGGPDANDVYTDSRSNFQQAEAGTANTAPIVGVLARLAA